MALDATARESNFKDSLKKFLRDNLESAQSIPLLFDKSLSTPKVQGREVDQWVAVRMGDVRPDSLMEAQVHFYVCTKKDPEGFKLSQLRDKVLGAFFDPTYPNGRIPVPLYRSHPTEAWVIIGYLTPVIIWQSELMDADDESKYKILQFTFKWSAKI